MWLQWRIGKEAWAAVRRWVSAGEERPPPPPALAVSQERVQGCEGRGG